LANLSKTESVKKDVIALGGEVALVAPPIAHAAPVPASAKRSYIKR
jgi:hypothetical protein